MPHPAEPSAADHAVGAQFQQDGATTYREDPNGPLGGRCKVDSIRRFTFVSQSPASKPCRKPRSRAKARVASETRTKNPCFPQFEKALHNDAGILVMLCSQHP